MEKTVSTKSISKRNSAGIGYIVLPLDIDREIYVRECYRKGAISIAMEDGGVVDDVIVSNEALNKLTFPKSSKELGSMIFWVNIPKKNQPIVIGTLNKNNEFIGLSENEFSFKRESDQGFVEVSGNGQNSELNIIVNNIGGRGKINLIAANKSSTAEVNVKVKGDIKMYASGNINLQAENSIIITIGNTTIKYVEDQGFTYQDQFGNLIEIEDQKMTIDSTEILHGKEAEESAVLGNTLQSILERLIDGINQLTVTTSSGPSGTPINAAVFTEIKGDLESIKSEKNKIE